MINLISVAVERIVADVLHGVAMVFIGDRRRYGQVIEVFIASCYLNGGCVVLENRVGQVTDIKTLRIETERNEKTRKEQGHAGSMTMQRKTDRFIFFAVFCLFDLPQNYEIKRMKPTL